MSDSEVELNFQGKQNDFSNLCFSHDADFATILFQHKLAILNYGFIAWLNINSFNSKQDWKYPKLMPL